MSTVLIVEDGLTDMQILSRYLQQAGYSVIIATSSEEIQSKLNHTKPDLIFLDVILPGKSGFEICRELKNNPHTSNIPIVFCSTKNTETDRIWANMLGGEAYLSKPINQEELVLTINKLKNKSMN